MEDAGTGVTELLVARAIQVCCQVHCRMQCMQPDKDLPYTEGGEADPQQGPQLMLASDLHRHDQRTPGLKRIQCHPSGGGPQIHTIPTVTSTRMALYPFESRSSLIMSMEI